ncbi:FAD/NAD(P)-binding domain-containing protein [Dichomitus squalens LYAD-421 SS1]|uniref:FAD/NAD(P)-binding domain-containing protein n=1 Tax=Dichomitus squalens (strain LYAD-421) TaxID=732165 RepID=R7SW64_DICSQ|nr:FAD/NAD(P)-binding domain-containing protein [Dichomitus squalens LYAD-421 SS1]EJF60316.1 FAD/NAD(P)-binding domain-containing protein [Dichomitus squalens LYAD-421 SS1]
MAAGSGGSEIQRRLGLRSSLWPSSMAGFLEVSIHDAGVSKTLMKEDPAPTYDYIVVGGGTLGAVLASRLSEDPTVSVLVLEKGQVVDTWITRIPLLFANPTSKNFRRSPRGGSRINGALYTRGTPYDYNRWEELGNVGWGYNDLEPY